MTHAEKLAAVRQKIVEACPELMQPTEGCLIKYKNQTYRISNNNAVHFLLWREEYRSFGCDCCTINFSQEDCEVIGHEPHLEHVLRALAHKEMKSGRLDIFIDLSFRFWKITNTNGVNDLKIISRWMPTKDLSNQPEATVDFLYSVICKK